jgi:hypothetical protein
VCYDELGVEVDATDGVVVVVAVAVGGAEVSPVTNLRHSGAILDNNAPSGCKRSTKRNSNGLSPNNTYFHFVENDDHHLRSERARWSN